MMEPICKKCRESLEYRKGDYWVCSKCGCKHMYIESEPTPTKDMMDIRQLAMMASSLIEDVASFSQRNMYTIDQIASFCAKGSQKTLITDIQEMRLEIQHGVDTIQRSLLRLDELLKHLEVTVTPMGNGEFVPLDEMFR